jgi:hypothetical protein
LVTLWVAGLASAPARGESLGGFRATMLVKASMTTVWSFPSVEESDDGCWVGSDSGSGSQTIDYDARGRAKVTIADAGTTIAFQLASDRRAEPNHEAPGFRGASASRFGSVKTVWHKSVHWEPACLPEPEQTVSDTGGCGQKKVPWDAQPLLAGNKLMPGIEAFLPSHMLAACDFFGPTGIDGDEVGSFPRQTETHLSAAKVRRVLSEKHGELNIKGKQRWHNESTQGSHYEVTATTTVHWDIDLIRSH